MTLHVGLAGQNKDFNGLLCRAICRDRGGTLPKHYQPHDAVEGQAKVLRS
jgi:hypothetical protein